MVAVFSPKMLISSCKTNWFHTPQDHNFSYHKKGKAFLLQALDRPLGFQEVEAPEFLDNRHRKVVRLSAIRTGRLYPQEEFLVLICVRGWVDPRDTMRPEGISHWKVPVTPSWIKPTTFQFVAQCLNQLHHRIPLIFLTMETINTCTHVNSKELSL
jgi:hypothetical protein